MIEKTLSQLIEKIENRYYGKYKGIVIDNDDPEKLGRLRVKIPSVLGENVVSGWSMPCVPYGGANDQGFFFIPEKDAGVWIEFEEGDLEFPIWVGTFWTKPGGATEVPKPGDIQSPPSRKIIRTVKENSIELEDKDNEEAIIITEKTNGNKITMNSNGIIVEDGNSNKIELTSSGVTITSSKIKIGQSALDASGQLVLGTTLSQLLSTFLVQLNTHIHTGNMGAPTSPPMVPMQLDISSALSKHLVEK
ncbi:hypothetical protein E3J59_02730 [Candidatus Aerophobetes bacterium]|uniref:Gp5/Type VI secretion system Vgr protein OB-fold domain-containing protein n=1 Tax=Aerophobetes bacterium TaxID=2030807 RepID=A0A523UW67_UNCAE|nr:MAG: hypothetical protein E3J59_02730 [Candidatus Aerophobetes bacterium]